MKKFTIAATALAVAASTISFAPAANAANVPASSASYGASCATVGATAAKKGADGSDLKCMKATKGTFKGKTIWNYATWPVLSAAEIVIPNTLGSGFGTFASKGIADSLKAEGLVKVEPVLTARPQPTYNLTLDYFNKDLAGKAGKLGVTGFAQAFGAQTSKSTTMPSSGVPAARMFAGYSAIAVNADSKYKTITQLMADLEKQPKALTIVGGNIGGVDHFAAVQLFEDQSMDVKDMSYVANNGKVAASILSDAKYAFGISDISDFAQYVKAGTIRILAITAPKAIAGVDAPTLKSKGINVVVANWRGIMLPPKTPVAAQKLVIRALDVVSKSKTYADYLTSQTGFQNFLPGAAWGSYLKGQEAALKKIAINAGLL